MNAQAVPLLAAFEAKIQLEVPLFQRQYVWSLEQQWLPLWEDVSQKFTEYLQGNTDAPPHFLGAVVVDQKQVPIVFVERRQVIDGQQRLTTLQIFLAAFRDFCREQGCREIAQEIEGYTLNKGIMADSDRDRFKVWPTRLDQSQFRDVIESGSRQELEERYPRTRRKYARRYDPRPRMVEAYIYFHDQIGEFFLGSEDDPPLARETDLSMRLMECFRALRNALHIVAINLEKDDDAQVIFETLNARGAPLLPADLLRNDIFLRAGRGGEDQSELYEAYWRDFDDAFWREEVKQGRFLRPRSDLFMQHFLSSQQCRVIPIKHLFVEYRHWIVRENPFDSVRSELQVLARQGGHFRRLIQPESSDILFALATFLARFDVGTSYPFLLFLADQGIDDQTWRRVSTIVEAYLLRRAVCGLTTKRYNRIFLDLTRKMMTDGFSVEGMLEFLADYRGESSVWPSDSEFERHWMEANMYGRLNNNMLVHILVRLDAAFRNASMEDIVVREKPTVEHLMPQRWIEHWKLPSGHDGLTEREVWEEEGDPDDRAATRVRNAAIHAIGNLTILTGSLNAEVSNSAWKEKKAGVMKSLLPINQMLGALDVWDEQAIALRARRLFEKARGIWSGPGTR